jgi:hypothetical protein
MKFIKRSVDEIWKEIKEAFWNFEPLWYFFSILQD